MRIPDRQASARQLRRFTRQCKFLRISFKKPINSEQWRIVAKDNTGFYQTKRRRQSTVSAQLKKKCFFCDMSLLH
jgi:hypothetical protein